MVNFYGFITWSKAKHGKETEFEYKVLDMSKLTRLAKLNKYLLVWKTLGLLKKQIYSSRVYKNCSRRRCKKV
jgi:hypothetical protein